MGEPAPEERKPRPWWLDAVGYEVYVPSFQDGNGDGWGDLPGVERRLEYLAWLGIDLVWLTPFYPSPLRDHGYDVSDYTDVDPRSGTLEDFDRLIETARRLEIRVIVDLVVNHSSSDHPWFERSRTSRDDPYRDYYIWRDPAPGGGPPNNWVASFGGSAWTFDERTGQYWLHLFLPEQPDLNWANPRVAEEIDGVLRFWLDRGVAGFRIDTAHFFLKDPELRDNPPVGDRTPNPAAAVEDWFRFEHRYDFGQPGVIEIHRRWRRIADEYDALLVGEVYVLDPRELARYLERGGLHLSFWFGLVESGWPLAPRDLLGSAAAATPDLAWVQSTHDRSRAVSRYGGGVEGRERALALSTLMAGLPGVVFLYQGEELGLENGVVEASQATDPLAVLGGARVIGRDPARTPMPWAPEPGLGFTTAARAWLPFGDRSPGDAVAVQLEDPTSWLRRHRDLIAVIRRAPSFRRGELRWIVADGPVVSYRRGEALIAANLGDEHGALELPEGRWRVLFGSRAGARDPAPEHERRLSLAPREALILIASHGA
jgi:alpha-glucosidase